MDASKLIKLAEKCEDSNSKRARRLAAAVIQYFGMIGSDDDDGITEVKEEFTNTFEIPGANILLDPASIDGLTYNTAMNAFQGYKTCYTRDGYDSLANRHKWEAFAEMDLSGALQEGESRIPYFDPVDWDHRENIRDPF